MKNCAGYVAAGKRVLGDRTSDAKLGIELGFAQQTIAKAKAGQMSDSVALALGELLKKHGLIDHPGEVIMVAHAERDADKRVRTTLLDYMGKVFASVPTKVASAVAAMALGLSLTLFPAADSQAATAHGGKGRHRFRRC